MTITLAVMTAVTQPSGPPTEANDVADYQSRASYLLGAIANLMITTGTRFYRQEFGIGVAEVRLMYVLGYETVLTARQAARIIGVDKGAISRTLANLERRGLVTTAADRTDARRRLIQFTRRGRELHRRLMPVVRQQEEAFMAPFTAEEARTLGDLLRRLHAHVPNLRQRARRPHRQGAQS